MKCAVEMRNITKRFGDFTANDQICLEIREGEVHAILGENGAGKTTLMNILYGLYACDGGSIHINGEEVEIDSPIAAIGHGIGMIHQHFMLIRAFTVLENVILGLKSGKAPFIDKQAAYEKVRRLATENNLTVDPDARISDLSVGQQQQVEILKAIYRGAKILIMDEPTSVLTPQETQVLFRTLESMASQGHTILFISHKLEEVLAISDRLTVLRKGKNVCSIDSAGVTKQKLAELMVGREFVPTKNKKRVEPGGVILDVADLHVPGSTIASAIKGVSFSVRSGQIVGVAGVDGNGQRELVEALAGLRHAQSGTVKIHGSDITNHSPLAIREEGIALVPEDRKSVGSIGKFNLVENAILRSYYKKQFMRRCLIDYQEANRFTDRIIEEYDIRTAGKNVETGLLSGGNIQKLILAREIHSDPEVLLAMHPTRGLDIGAIEFVHKRLLEQRERQKAVLLVSTELDEIMNLSDVILVLYNGEITGMLHAEGVSAEHIGKMMPGESRDFSAQPHAGKESGVTV